MWLEGRLGRKRWTSDSDRIEKIHLAGWRELVVTSATTVLFPWGVPANSLEIGTWTKDGYFHGRVCIALP